MKKKYLSRKFIVAMIIIIANIATALSGVGGIVGLVAGLVAATLTAVYYIVTEGKIDQVSALKAVRDAIKLYEVLEAKDVKITGDIDINKLVDDIADAINKRGDVIK